MQKERENLTAELDILRERNEKSQKQLDRYQRECHQALQDAKMYREKLEGLQTQLSRHQEDQELSKAEHEMMVEKVGIDAKIVFVTLTLLTPFPAPKTYRSTELRATCLRCKTNWTRVKTRSRDLTLNSVCLLDIVCG